VSSLLFQLSKESLNVAALERIYLDHHMSPAFAADAIFAMRQLDSELAWRAAWLLRRQALDQGLEEGALVRMATFVDEMTHWIARLNICQMLAITGCPRLVQDSVFPYLDECFRDRRAIVRAWAISALASFSDEPKYRRQILLMIRKARMDSAKSIQARLRHLAPPNQSPVQTLASGTSHAGREPRHRWRGSRQR
jgi:hypothetical protein